MTEAIGRVLLVGGVFVACAEVLRLARTTRPVLVQVNGDGTSCRDYEEAA